MHYIYMKWESHKCAVLHLKRGKRDEQPAVQLNWTATIKAVDDKDEFLETDHRINHDSPVILDKGDKEFLI